MNRKKLGAIPQEAGSLPTEYELPFGLNNRPNEILVYMFTTLENKTSNSLQRGYYTVYTEKNDGTKCKFYMNVAMTNNVNINSENFWLPYGEDFKPHVYVILTGVNGATFSESTTAVGEVFITGYK